MPGPEERGVGWSDSGGGEGTSGLGAVGGKVWKVQGCWQQSFKCSPSWRERKSRERRSGERRRVLAQHISRARDGGRGSLAKSRHPPGMSARSSPCSLLPEMR